MKEKQKTQYLQGIADMIQGVESSPFFVGWHRGFTQSFRRFECFWLFDFKTGHEPVELLPGQLLYFQLISGPAESALDFHTFIQKELFEFLDKCCCTSGLKTETSDGPVPRKKHWRSARTSIKC